MLKYSDDYAKSVAEQEFWYLDTDATNVTAAAATNHGIRARALLSQGDHIKTIKTGIPLNRFSFFEDLEDKLLPPMQLTFNIELQSELLSEKLSCGSPNCR